MPTTGGGIAVSVREGLGIASVFVRRHKRAALERRVRDLWGLELPHGPKCVIAGELSLLGTGPGAWLALHRHGSDDFAASLRTSLVDLASVSEVSDAWSVTSLRGPRVREVLCKVVPVDVHPRAFGVGAVAVTVAAQIGAILWRLEDDADSSSSFEIAVARSMTMSFWRTLFESAAEFGYTLTWPPRERDSADLVSRSADSA